MPTCQKLTQTGHQCSRPVSKSGQRCWQHSNMKRQKGGFAVKFDTYFQIKSPNTRKLKSLIIEPSQYAYDINEAIDKLNSGQLQSKLPDFVVVLDERLPGYQLLYRSGNVSGTEAEIINTALTQLQ